MTIQNEFTILKNFFTKEDKRKYSGLFKTKNGRTRFVKKLAHHIVFDRKFLKKIEPNNQYSNKILNILHAKGAGKDCYIISDRSTLDSKRMLLDEALENVVGFGFGTILCCIPGKLLYYEGESPGERYIVECKNTF